MRRGRVDRREKAQALHHPHFCSPAVNKGVWGIHGTAQIGALPLGQCPTLPAWAKLGITE